MTNEQMQKLVKGCGLDWSSGYFPLFDGDTTNRYAVLIETVTAEGDLLRAAVALATAKNDLLRAAIAAAMPAMRAYAGENPGYVVGGVPQDPNGVHAWLRENDGARS